LISADDEIVQFASEEAGVGGSIPPRGTIEEIASFEGSPRFARRLICIGFSGQKCVRTNSRILRQKTKLPKQNSPPDSQNKTPVMRAIARITGERELMYRKLTRND